ncbi:hypothetical protein KP509_18G046400 [Ceratopteris richardii]|nr:hypothetical protein KP509_18G046400 [Ceratopteris richardii]KAH7365791.1 hypothetical protein KP509_18G046400 [Ceratopteris richardii]
MEQMPPVEDISHQTYDSNPSDRGSDKNKVLEVESTLSFPMSEDLPNESNNANQGNVSKLKKVSRRKQSENQDPCLLRGVYFKNMKWQAAIKVEKKQIHLGTVSSMEEAARLYDRAAYLCGRVPNFELSEEEKQELEGLQWEDFLQITKDAIANKKKQKRVENCVRRRRPSDLSEDGKESASNLLNPCKTFPSYEDVIYHQSFQQPASFDEQDLYKQTTYDEESWAIYEQAATLASFQQTPSPSQGVAFEKSASFLPPEHSLVQAYQKSPIYSTEYHFPHSLHQQTVYTGNMNAP